MRKSSFHILFVSGWLLAASALAPDARGQANLIDRVVASVNGEIITLSETREAAWGLTGKARALTATDSQELAEALDAVIQQRLMLQAAEAAGIKLDPELLDRSVASLMKDFHEQFDSEENYRQFLEQSNLTADTLRSMIRLRESRVQLIQRALARRVRVTDEEVKAFEESQRKAGNETDYFLIGQMLFALPENAGATSDTQAFRRAADAAARVQRGEDFARVAAETSDDAATAKKGGALGWIARKHLKPELLKALSKIGEDEITPPVRTPAGYHVLRFQGRRDARTQLLQQKAIEERKRWGEELKQKANIRYFPLQAKTEGKIEATSSGRRITDDKR
ncbi:MAG: peptidylprolyl isomerase [Candidatus Sumerlaeota bacterium]|nr:peptidylprolyl isomerase [Candidatus Sumerlaeota bacterium]